MIIKTYSSIKVGLCNYRRGWSTLSAEFWELRKLPQVAEHINVNLQGMTPEDSVILIFCDLMGKATWTMWVSTNRTGCGMRWPSRGLLVHTLCDLKEVHSINIHRAYMLHSKCWCKDWGSRKSQPRIMCWSGVTGSRSRENCEQFPTFSISLDWDD